MKFEGLLQTTAVHTVVRMGLELDLVGLHTSPINEYITSVLPESMRWSVYQMNEGQMVGDFPPQPAADAKDKARFKERYGKDAFPLVPTWVLGLKVFMLYFEPYNNDLKCLCANKIVTISFNLAELISELSKIFPTLLRWLQFTSPVTYGESLVDDTPIPTDYLLGVTLVVTGALIRVTSYRYLGRHFTWDVSLQRDHKLIVNGPYSIVRHPSYAGSVLFLAGALISQMGQGSWWNHHIWSMAAGKGFVKKIRSCVVSLGIDGLNGRNVHPTD
ncbi:hypothetical protein PHLCEN_2v13259 [Hermanssonia centrifuga]|uniref:Uncharacterized protein n=1 Tax=Hermanssonia centrifuga TaxID=98765 RepID=A0A2R6NEY7_9APHY|nr:hypothetical protein PHLCEN_2v13259 [Hermanssonia centrifuga]